MRALPSPDGRPTSTLRVGSTNLTNIKNLRLAVQVDNLCTGRADAELAPKTQARSAANCFTAFASRSTSSSSRKNARLALTA